MLYVRYPLSLRQVEERLFERGIEICYETVRYWWNRFGPLFAAEIRTRRVHHGSYSNWRWHLDEVLVRINGKTHYLWRAVDHEGEVLEVFVTKRRDRKAALEFLKGTMKRYGRPASIVTDRLPSYRAAMKVFLKGLDCRFYRSDPVSLTMPSTQYIARPQLVRFGPKMRTFTPRWSNYPTDPTDHFVSGIHTR